MGGQSQGNTSTVTPARGSTATRLGRAAAPRTDRLPPFNVLLHNDDVNDMFHVVRSLVELTPLNPPRAAAVMLRAHTRGVAHVLTTHKERAELYRDQFRSKGLRVSIEPGIA